MNRPSLPLPSALPAAMLLALLAGCEKNYYTTTPPPASGTPPPVAFTPTDLGRADDAPGVVVTILGVSGASAGSFQPGDQVTVTFAAKKNNGTAWQLGEFTSNGIMVSGPTFNYQRVIPEQRDVTTRATQNDDGTFSYTFALPLPSVYAAPINDSASFGELDGELAGQQLLAGTYTVGMYLGWNYTVAGQSYRDGGDATADFAFGSAGTVNARAVVAQDNCNQCHSSLRAHGGTRRSVTLCLLCHTSGAEDKNDASLAGGTPDVAIDFRVMIHKIHNGANLPSVLGVATTTTGARNYAATPRPYQVVGRSVHDYSTVRFPVFPNLSVAMPRDSGHAALPSASQALEDATRTGAADCTACHGDPDGTGPLAAPAQGEIAYAQPTRRACGSCHDDVDWLHPYTSNQQTMPAQLDDSACILCHRQGNGLDPEMAHVHPLRNPAFNPGLKVDLSAIAEAGKHNSNGSIDPGERVAATFRLVDDGGNTVAPSSVASMNVVLAGPTNNNNLVLYTTVPMAALTGSQPFTIKLPEPVYLEYLGTATAAPGESFTSSRAPHWQVTGALTSVWVRTATSGGNTTLAAASTAPANYIDVADGNGFARNDYIVVDDGQPGVEYAQVQTREGNRLWFSSPYTSAYSPGMRRPHALGATVQRVVLTAKTLNTHYSLNAPAGTLTELQEFGAGNAVVATYTTDFVMPSVYPVTLNDVPDLDESWGHWTGKPIADGTYAVTMWGSRTLTLAQYGETNSYRVTAEGARFEFLVGSATTLEPYQLIDSASACYNCHKEIGFHGYGRRGFNTCVACHGNAGIGDRPQYVAPNAPATNGVSVEFRTMLHKIHMGKDMANAASYLVNGQSGAAYPNNYSVHTYTEVGFPGMPGGVMDCIKCHGANNGAWLEPAPRNHPTAQGLPVRSWRSTCAACHDSDAAQAHIGLQTLNGVESCSICHGQGKEWHVQLMHKPR